MRRDRELERRLREAPIPSEDEAEERSWEVVRAAYADRTPVKPTYRARRLALVIAAGIALLAIGLSPAGAKVGDWVRDVVGEEDAKPALRSLPAAGELLVNSEQGPWIVREDGSKRLLGDYGDATWSPRGLFVAAANGRELVAVDPLGNVRWTVPTPDTVHDPRWSPSGFRIAYRSGDDLRVVAGDGTGDRLIAREVAPVPPVWRPIGDSKLAATTDASGSHVLTYLELDADVRAVDVDTDAALPVTRRDGELLSTASLGGSPSPDGQSLAFVRHLHGEQLVLAQPGGQRGKVLFSAPGNLTGPTWSPDSRWILIGWPQADQWLFIRADGGCLTHPEEPRCLVPIGDISSQFESGGDGGGDFPRVGGWILPQR